MPWGRGVTGGALTGFLEKRRNELLKAVVSLSVEIFFGFHPSSKFQLSNSAAADSVGVVQSDFEHLYDAQRGQ